MNRVINAGLIPVGFQTMSLGNTTAVAVNTTCRAGNVLDICAETVDVRYRADGTVPRNATGVLFPKAVWQRWYGYNGTSNLKFCRAGITSAAVVSIFSWRQGPAR